MGVPGYGGLGGGEGEASASAESEYCSDYVPAGRLAAEDAQGVRGVFWKILKNNGVASLSRSVFRWSRRAVGSVQTLFPLHSVFPPLARSFSHSHTHTLPSLSLSLCLSHTNKHAARGERLPPVQTMADEVIQAFVTNSRAESKSIGYERVTDEAFAGVVSWRGWRVWGMRRCALRTSLHPLDSNYLGLHPIPDGDVLTPHGIHEQQIPRARATRATRFMALGATKPGILQGESVPFSGTYSVHPSDWKLPM